MDFRVAGNGHLDLSVYIGIMLIQLPRTYCLGPESNNLLEALQVLRSSGDIAGYCWTILLRIFVYNKINISASHDLCSSDLCCWAPKDF